MDDASQEAGSSQNKVPFTKERNLDRCSEKFMSDNSGADLKEHLRQNLTNSNFSSDRIRKDTRSDVVLDLSRKKVSFAEEVRLEIFDESKPPVTPVRTTGNSSLNEHTQSGSSLRSVLKKTPVKQLMERMKEYSNDAVDTEGGEPPAVSNCTKIFEALEKEKAEGHSSERPMKKRVTFGEALSPEIFDETLPANTPLRKGATPVRHPGLQSNSPAARSSLIEEPLPQPNFDCEDVSFLLVWVFCLLGILIIKAASEAL
ncbi:cell division cycle-associated protein 2 [Limosa lapponica baueri]|uniref:Cell division cycle-associated protein 2 n=1 Tax=Limosa lapponica baueri TaxID=1758121 RepID=A0A2I0T3C4_LIMLA|nr:cell division cycle-associated protein 2 [Limosa lapponica baueri]